MDKEMDPKDIEVVIELDILSGQQNPTWRLPHDQVGVLEEKLKNLPKSIVLLVECSGYRGFVIKPQNGLRRFADKIRVYRSLLIMENEGTRTGYVDAHDIEAWLKEQARERGYPNIEGLY